jgi:PAS domain S-box-containing protein
MSASDAASPTAPANRRVSLTRRLRLASGVMIGAVAALALLVLGSWLFDLPSVTGGGSRPITMTVGTALVLLLASLAVGIQYFEGVALSPSRILLISSGATVLLVLWSLLEFSTGWRLGIDAVFAAGGSATATTAGAPALLPLVGTLLLVGATVLAGHPAHYGAAQVLGIGAMGLAMFDGSGHLFAVPASAVAGTPGVMAGPAAAGLFMLSVGLLLSQPDRGIAQMATDTGPGGSMVRRYLPAVIVVPIAAGWVIWQGVSAEAYPPALGAALLATIAGLAPAGLLLLGSRLPADFEQGAPAGLDERAAGRSETQEQLRRAVIDAPIPMVVHDGEQILDMNRAWSDIAGISASQAPTISAWVTQVQPSKVDDLPAFRARLAEATGTVLDHEQVVRAPDGEERVWEFSSTPISHPGADRRLYVTMAVDVTERRAAEGALRKLNEDLEQRAAERTAALTRANDALKRQSDQLREQTLLLDLVREGILVRDLYGTIVYWNHGAATMYGWPKEEALGKASHQLLAAEYPIPLADIEKEVMRAGFWEGDVVYATRRGTRLMVESRWTLTRTERGKPEGFLEVHRDITQRRQAERALQAKNEALARSNHELEQFAYVASHDLQEPLRMVSNYTQLLARRYRDRLDSDANEFIDFAVDGAKRMQDLIHDLLQYARVERRGREFHPVPAETIVGDALSNLAGAITESKASIVVDALPTLTCDASQMTQVFQNLIGNAVKFRKPDQAPVVRVSASREDGAWRLSVADNGIGIEPRFFERIFQMFQRLHARGDYSGTGIGLALCKKIVERHGGQMRVESAPGHGAKFSFTVPDVIPPA